MVSWTLAGITIHGDILITFVMVYTLLTLLKLYGLYVLAVLADFAANFEADELEEWLEHARARRNNVYAHSSSTDSDSADTNFTDSDYPGSD